MRDAAAGAFFFKDGMSNNLNIVLDKIKQQKLDRQYGPSDNRSKKSKKSLRNTQQGFFKGVTVYGGA
jgi:hypothetical protein